MEYSNRDFDSGLIVKAGWLHVNMPTSFCCCTWGAWEKRFVVIRNNTVFIYSGENATVPLRQFSLYAATCSADVTGDKSYIYLQSVSQGNLDIQSRSVDECREWAIALQLCAIKATGGSVAKTGGVPAGMFAGMGDGYGALDE